MHYEFPFVICLWAEQQLYFQLLKAASLSFTITHFNPFCIFHLLVLQMEDVCVFFEDVSDPRPIDRCVFPSNDDENYQDKNFPFCLHRKTEQQLGLYEEVWWWGGDCFCSYFCFFIFSLLSGLQLQSTCIFCVAVLFYKGTHIQKHVVMWQSSRHTKW